MKEGFVKLLVRSIQRVLLLGHHLYGCGVALLESPKVLDF